jgi:hypothetical protein
VTFHGNPSFDFRRHSDLPRVPPNSPIPLVQELKLCVTSRRYFSRATYAARPNIPRVRTEREVSCVTPTPIPLDFYCRRRFAEPDDPAARTVGSDARFVPCASAPRVSRSSVSIATQVRSDRVRRHVANVPFRRADFSNSWVFHHRGGHSSEYSHWHRPCSNDELDAESSRRRGFRSAEMSRCVRRATSRETHRAVEGEASRTSLIGTLNDLSLFNLVQLHCCERQRAQVSLTHGEHAGKLIFTDGELVFAGGGLTGEDAVHELLTWEDGDFRVDYALPRWREMSRPRGVRCFWKGSGAWTRRAPNATRGWRPR